jgi:hypothetical protein
MKTKQQRHCFLPPVQIVPFKDKNSSFFGIENESGEVLAKFNNRSSCYDWCRKNKCHPVNNDWVTVETRFSFYHWYGHPPSLSRDIFGAKRMLLTEEGKYSLALWETPEKTGWHLYKKSHPTDYTYNALSIAGPESIDWKESDAIHWAESYLACNLKSE